MSCPVPRPGAEIPAFAADSATAGYYERRAGEYDEWYEGTGLFADSDRPGWPAEVERLADTIRRLAPARTLDVACGTAFLSRHLRGEVVGIDRSLSMVSIALGRLPGPVLQGDALHIGVRRGRFDRVFTGHFYGHLPTDERLAFAAEAARVAPELVVVDSAPRPGVDAEGWQDRVLNDGSRHRVYKRYLSAGRLADEISGEPIFEGQWFSAARRRLPTLPDGVGRDGPVSVR